MRLRRRLVFAAGAIVAGACGLDLAGALPGGAGGASHDDGGGSASDHDAAMPPSAEASLEADASLAGDAGCVSPDSFCDTCDPTLVLCLRFDGGVADESRYRRRVDVVGAPVFGAVDGLPALLADGTATITVPPGPLPDPLPAVTLEVVARARPLPSTGARYGLIDREGPGDVAFFLQADGSLRCGNGSFLSAPGTDDGGLAHRACVLARGKTESFHGGERVGAWDAGDPSLTAATEALVLLANSPSGDPFRGEVVSIRIYSRAKSAAEIARAASAR